MRNLKKVLTLVLCLAMMMSIMVVGAGAAFSDQSKIKNTEAVDMCVALNIINGYTDGSYKPEGNVTRAEMCKMICIALNGGKEPSVGTNATPSFTDIDGHWAEGYIESCVAQGIVAGVGGGKFNPNGNVTGSQAAKMLLVALGYSADDAGFVGNSWEVNVNVKATQKDLYDELESMDVSAPLTRDNAAQMIWNALQAKEVKYTYTLIGSNGNLSSQVTVEDKNSTLLYSKYNGIILETTLEDVSYNSDKGEWTYTTGTGVAFGDGEENVRVERDFTGDVNYCDLYKQAVKVVYTVKNGSVDDFLGMVSDADVLASGVIGDIDAVAVNDDEVTINDVDYKLNKDTNKATGAYGEVEVVPYLNGSTKTTTTLTAATGDNGLCGAFAFWAIDNNDDNRIDRVVYVPVTVGQIDYLSSSSITISNGVGNEDLDDVNLYDGADEDDWVVVIPAANTDDDTMAITKAEIVSGEVTRIKGTATNPTDVQVNGTWYEIYSNIKNDPIKVNDSYDLTVVNGYVFSAEKTAGNVSASNILYIDKCAALSSGLADGVEAKVYFAGGTSSTVTITEVTKTDGEDYDVVADVYKEGNLDNTQKASDEIFASEAVSFLNGYQLFTFSEKNGEYSVEPVYSGNVGSYDDYMTLTATNLVDGKTNDGTRFAEDAVVFVKDKDGDISIKTGSTVSGWKDIKTTDGKAISVAGLYDESNGYSYIAIGFIDLKNSNASTDARVYGYITSSITSGKEDGTTYLYFDMWNGEETIEVKVEDDVTIEKYDFVAFDWADEAANEADTADFTAVSATEGAVAVKAYVTGDTIKFVKQDGTETANFDFADDYFIIGVDTKNGKGAGAKLATAKDCQEVVEGETHGNGLYANAIYFMNGDEVEAIFVDANGMMYTEKNGDKICTCVDVAE